MVQADFIDVPLRASRWLALAMATAHAAALIAVAVLPLAAWLRIAIWLLLLPSAYLTVRHALLQGVATCVGLRLMRDGSCQLRLANGSLVSGQLCHRWFVSPPLIVMRIACEGERWPRGIALLPDAADRDVLRRLRIFLRFVVGSSVGNQ